MQPRVGNDRQRLNESLPVDGKGYFVVARRRPDSSARGPATCGQTRISERPDESVHAGRGRKRRRSVEPLRGGGELGRIGVRDGIRGAKAANKTVVLVEDLQRQRLRGRGVQ